MNKTNYIIIKLSDNDFGGDLHDGLKKLVDTAELKNLNPDIVKKYIIEYIICERKFRAILGQNSYDGEDAREYLQRIDVEFSRKAPQGLDHDGGSVFYDVCRGNVCNF